MKQQHTPFDLPRATRLSLALCLGMALTGAHAQVSEATRAKVAELQKDPNFKLKGSARKCMSGELVDPDCDDIVAKGIELHQAKVEITRLDGEKARLDGELARNNEVIARNNEVIARNELIIVVQSHVGSAIFLVDTLNYALLQTPESGLRTEYLTWKLPADVTQYITGILAKLDAKRPITQDDLRTFDTLYQEHSQKAVQLIKDNPQLGNIKAKDYLERIQIAHAAVRPRYDAAVRR